MENKEYSEVYEYLLELSEERMALSKEINNRVVNRLASVSELGEVFTKRNRIIESEIEYMEKNLEDLQENSIYVITKIKKMLEDSKYLENQFVCEQEYINEVFRIFEPGKMLELYKLREITLNNKIAWDAKIDELLNELH